jgi:hypothetical protein
MTLHVTRQERHMATIEPTDTAGEPRAVRLLVSSRGAAVAAVSGYLFGVVGFYTNFFQSILQATAVLADVSTILLAVALWLTGTWTRIYRRAGLRRTLVGTSLAVLLVGAVNLYGIRPPGLTTTRQQEACVYNVSANAGVPIPLEDGGSATQRLQLNTNRINSVSIIAGIDPHTAHQDRPHPMRMHIRTRDGSIDLTLRRDDIVNNAFSRFEFPEPVEIEPHQALTARAVNESDDPVSIYVKQPDPTDTADGASSDVYIQGHVDNEAGYEKPGYVLSGCVTRPAN